MNQFDDIDDTIFSIINSVTKDSSPLNNALLSEALISTQKAIKQLESIKSAIANKEITPNVGKQLLLCAEVEKINSSLLRIKREYNL